MVMLITVPRIESRIQVIRSLRVMLDERNRDHFARDFLFQLMQDKKPEVVAHCDYLQNLKFSKAPTTPPEPPKRAIRFLTH